MKCYISVVCVLSAFVALSLAAPAVVEDTAIASVHNQSPTLIDDNNTVKRHIRIARSADDQEAAASGGNGPDPAEDLANVDTDDADRNKRYLPFGGDGHSAGGSGNFLFDLIRLVAGSGATEASDEKEAGIGGVAEIDVAPKAVDGHGEGIPGPITRLLVIANRGIANLIQDLILRLAQTSERIVNFKARLITALI
ncbi:hypothetical protein ILUMI_26529 [Ignelater luminosus]|uniref:RxLR effector protein n=1 Tax=Ignelater luminosus TaxID=2038154 RepID=A0A8K0C4A2_IGNLU|nr:hypothetical protein ILUMI_26529 [Ignelater luminosus]